MHFVSRFFCSKYICGGFLLVLFLAGCNDYSPAIASFVDIKIPINHFSRTFDLPAQQQLRDINGDFSVRKAGADTGIFLLAGEKVEIFVSGVVNVQSEGHPLGPEGIKTCLRSDLPEPDLPCYSVVYSIGIGGRAGEVGSHIGFNPPNGGNLFLGVNTLNAVASVGSFSVKVLVIPAGTAAGLWVAPENGFTVQGVNTVLSARIFAQDALISRVQFTAIIAGAAPIPICDAQLIGGDTYSCNWRFKQHGKILHNGSVTFGFVLSVQSQSGKLLEPVVNPDGVRTGSIRYILRQDGNYAGYAATNLNTVGTYQKVVGSWVVPQVHCTPGEISSMGTWVGMTNGTSAESILAQLGSESDCFHGVPVYGLWWEMYPAPSVPLKFGVLPGDVVTASVTFQNGKFQLNIDDPLGHIHFSTRQDGKPSDTSIAECIIEAPVIIDNAATNETHMSQLTNFGKMDITCQLENNKPIADGPQDVLYQMKENDVLQATTSQLDIPGSGFSVQWKHG